MTRRGGWRRHGRKPRFRHVDARGNAIREEGRLARIESLVIPPAWNDVWISSNAAAKLQVTGVDVAGRRQYGGSDRRVAPEGVDQAAGHAPETGVRATRPSLVAVLKLSIPIYHLVPRFAIAIA